MLGAAKLNSPLQKVYFFCNVLVWSMYVCNRTQTSICKCHSSASIDLPCLAAWL